MAEKKATYKVKNANGAYDEINFKTTAEQVKDKSGKSIQNFFDKGGAIGGEKNSDGITLTVNDKVKTDYIISRDEYLRLFATDKQNKQNGLIIALNSTPYRLYSEITNTVSLGDYNHRFSDVYVNSSSTAESNGYTKITNEFVIQWGIIKLSTSKTKITLPVKFPKHCFNVVLTPKNEKGGTGKVVSVTQTDFYALHDGTGTVEFNFIAIGH